VDERRAERRRVGDGERRERLVDAEIVMKTADCREPGRARGDENDEDAGRWATEYTDYTDYTE
jgi:hypothetical protein